MENLFVCLFFLITFFSFCPCRVAVTVNVISSLLVEQIVRPWSDINSCQYIFNNIFLIYLYKTIYDYILYVLIFTYDIFCNNYN